MGLMTNHRVSRAQDQAGGISRMGDAKKEAKPILRVNWTQEMDQGKGEELSPRRSSREMAGQGLKLGEGTRASPGEHKKGPAQGTNFQKCS